MHPPTPYNNPFVRDSLQPESTSGDKGQVYQLTSASVNPTVIVAYDQLGMPIEDTVPACYWRPFVHPCGAVNKVPLRTGPVYSQEPDAARYEQTEMQRLILKGWLPLWACPYTAEFSYVRRGPLVPPPEGAEDCGGRPEGCVHMKHVIEERSKKWRNRFDEEMKRVRDMNDQERNAMVAAVTEGVGAAIAEHMKADPRETLKANRQNLRKSGDDS